VERDEAVALVRSIVDEAWTQTGKALPGSRLKALALKRAGENGQQFDEKALGYARFLDFVRANGVGEVLGRSGTDVLIAPTGQSLELTRQATSSRPAARIRAEFWDAFLRFPDRDRRRAYDPDSDRILDLPADDTPPAGVIPIDPVDKETQIGWRRDFLVGLGDSPLAEEAGHLSPLGGFAVFSVLLETHPAIRSDWYRAWRNQVDEAIRNWASTHGVRDGVWIEAERRQSDEELRARIYRVLDTLPVARLRELPIPIGWLVDR
jgi:hypothetical protein